MEQLSLFENFKQKTKNKKVTYFKTNKIRNNIKIWNTIKHIYRYQTLYKICSILYLLTYNNQLACLNYYNDTEKDCDKFYTVMYAEIEETSALCLKDRILKHIELLRRVLNNDKTLEHDIKKIDNNENNNSLFS